MRTAVHPNSIESYRQLSLTVRQQEVFTALRVMGRATDQRIAEYLNYPINRVTGRITELRDMGAVVECGSVVGEFGKHVRVCRIREFQEALF